MAPKGMIAATTVLLCFILGLLGPAPAALGSNTGKLCCTRYNRKPVPFQRIKGYREQTTKENCHIDAIIFYTIKRNEICATRKDEWVRKTLELLSSKLRKMSKTGPAAGETTMKKGGFYIATTETFINSTESYYS
ncbi:C-C motif chemokine 17-like [Plectropomus leopardus]|uniref:C-C motif chemokine 17-like n=1 Tax=Plectropomus leopardus TaxID=160734 RepID=UPI001C4B7909|nr:C-C motif chemokine 17-like [Plectropomus leopardus]